MKRLRSSPPKIEVSRTGDATAAAEIFAALWAYSEERGGPAARQGLTIAVRNDDGLLIGGLTARTSWGWLFIDDFWLSDELRGQGTGHELLTKAEAEAIGRGCHSAWLDTFTFHGARPFYEAHGYKVFGELKDYPAGYNRLFMQKQLVPAA